MTTLSTEPAASGLPRCLENAAGAEQELDRISTRTTGQTQRQATVTVEAIIERVRQEGDAALMALTQQFDGFLPEPLRVPTSDLQQAWETSEGYGKGRTTSQAAPALTRPERPGRKRSMTAASACAFSAGSSTMRAVPKHIAAR